MRNEESGIRNWEEWLPRSFSGSRFLIPFSVYTTNSSVTDAFSGQTRRLPPLRV